MNKIYFDNASSVPVYEDIKNSLNFDIIGNPAASHVHGKHAQSLLESYRDKVAKFFTRSSQDVIFTSGATEANNLAIHGLAKNIDLFLVDSTSHPSALFPVQKHNHIKLRMLSNGKIDEEFLHKTIYENSDKKICIVITPVNHITGVVQDIKLSNLSKDIIVHADCAQAIHKIHNYKNYDSITISGHKIGAPIGVGALIINDKVKSVPLDPLFQGGKMEFNYRPGTVNYIFAHSLSQSLEVPYTNPSHDDFESLVKSHNGIIVGEEATRSGSVSCVVMPGVESFVQLHEFSRRGISVSMGSSCVPNTYIFEALGMNEYANYAIRISSGPCNSKKDFEALSEAWIEIQKKFKMAV